MRQVLGLDIGTNSVGWALIEEDDRGQPKRVIACGSRIFQACIDDKTKTPLNQARRSKRLLRRQIARRRQRRDLVRGILQTTGMLTRELGSDPDGQAGIWNQIGDPYRLRAEALDRKLDLNELGRIFLAISKRRGFQSNRKAETPKDDKDMTATDEGIAGFRGKIAASGIRTLGEFLWKKAERRDNDLIVRNRLGIRHVWSERAMVREEFEAIWASQARYHAAILNDDLKTRLYRAIFWQRPLKAPPRSSDGCAYEPSKTIRDIKAGVDRVITPPRAAMAWPALQRFRYWQKINDLRWRDPQTLDERQLTPEQRQELARAFEQNDSLSWSKIRKILNLHKGCALNLQDSTEDKGLKGNTTAHRLREKLNEDWGALDAWVVKNGSERLRIQLRKAFNDANVFVKRHGLTETGMIDAAQDLLVADLLTIDDHPTDGPIPLLKRLQEDWGFSLAEAHDLARVELERKPGRCSMKAAKRLLPHLIAGKNLHDAAQAVGYERRDQKIHARRVFLGEPPKLRNPVVNRALTEVRRVVNAIVARFGTPEMVRVELAREATMTARERSESEKERKSLEKANTEADEWWREQCPGHSPNRDDRVMYRLWKRQKERCLYSDRAISGTQLTDGSVQVDHILPYSQSLDDSFANKALVFAGKNQEKGNRTPRAWLNDKEYAELMQRARGMPLLGGAVLKRLTTEKVELDEFIARALVDTRWISRAVLGYLRQLWPSHDGAGKFLVRVEAPRGHTTAALRHQWGLHGLLGGHAGKNRDDHRHHALDAVVIACTGRRIYEQAARAFAVRRHAYDVELPWSTFQVDLKSALDGITVSHATDRRIRGSFHDDSAFGLIRGPGGKEIFVMRRRLEALTEVQVDRIVDPKVREMVKGAISRHGSAKKAAEAGLLHADGKTPIRKVRVAANFSKESLFAAKRRSRDFRFHELSNNHRMEVLRDKTGSIVARLVRMIDHAQATRIYEAEIRKVDKASTTAELHRAAISALPDRLKSLKDGTTGALMLSLHKGDAVRVDGGNIGRVDKITLSGRSPDVFIRLHTDAAMAKEAKRIRITNLSDLLSRVRPIAVNVLGEVSDDKTYRGGRQPSASAPE